jgi:eukaryotic-like serine/threonine-protein kinase
MTLREQFERVLRITLLVFVLAAAGFISAVTAIRIAIRGRIVVMPNLVGEPVTEAQRVLAAKGLQLRVADRIFSSLPTNTVARQTPPPGEQVKVSQDAHVVLSLGPQTVNVPPLEGFSMRAGRIALLESGLQLGEVSTVYLPGAAPDTVLKQNPPPGSAATRPAIDVLVSESEHPVYYIMPSLIGLDQTEAERMLAGAGLRIGTVTHIAQTGALKGTVIGQTPPRGTRLAADTAIDIGVAE